jgi:hypothetical protein
MAFEHLADATLAFETIGARDRTNPNTKDIP